MTSRKSLNREASAAILQPRPCRRAPAARPLNPNLLASVPFSHSRDSPAVTSARVVPEMEPYRRHVLICTGGFCSAGRRGHALYSQLAALLEREDLLFGPARVKRSEAPCLGVCAGGPIVVVYPEGVWYAGVTPEFLERIVVEHLRDGHVIDEAVFHRLAV